MASFSEARTRSANIPVATVNAPGVADRATSNAIAAFGQIAGDVRKGKLKADLQTELEESSLIVNALNDSETQVLAPGIDISGADPEGIIDTTSAKYQRLAKARQQGLIDENQVALEGETLLRQAITKAPGFEPEFRKLAADAVGFDVTGAATRTFFGLGRISTSKRLTELEKMQEQADAVATVLNLDPQQSLQLIAKRALQEVQDSIIDSNLQRNQIQAIEYANTSASDMEASSLGILANAIGPDGKIADIDGVKADIQGLFIIHKNRAIQSTVNNGVINAESRAEVVSILEGSRDAFFTMVDNQDMVKFMSEKRGVMADVIAIRGLQMFPELALMESVGGQAWVEDYLNNIDLTDGNPKKIEALKAANPAYRKQLEIIAAGQPNKFAQIFQRIQNGTADQIPEADKELGQAVSTMGLETSLNQGDGDRASKYAEASFEQGLIKLPLSVLASRNNGYSMLDTRSKQMALDSYSANTITTATDLINELKGTGYQLAWDGETQRFVPVASNRARDFGAVLKDSSGRAIGNQGSNDMRYLNEVLLGLQRDPTFRKDAGIDSTEAWAAGIIARVNEEVAPAPFSLAEHISATSPLQRVDPGVFQDENGNIFRMGDSGNFTQIGGVDESGSTKVIAPREPDINPEADANLVEDARNAASANDIPENLFLALVQKESSFIDGQTSSAGARGLTQLMPITAEELGVDMEDPLSQLDGGAKYLKRMLDRFGSVEAALAAYNWGPGNYAKALRSAGTHEAIALPAETQAYIETIKANAGIE